MTRLPQLSLLAALAFAAGAAASAPRAAAQAADEPGAGVVIDDTRLMLDRWLEVRRTIAKEKNQWALSKEVLESRIDLIKRNIEEAQKQLDDQKTKLAGFDDRIAELEAKNQKLKQAAEQLEVLVNQMETRALTLLEGAPEPLLDQVKPLAVQLPGFTKPKGADAATPAATASDAGSEPQSGDEAEDKDKANADAKAEVPLSRRVETVVGVLYLFNKYAGKIDQNSQLVKRADGSTLSVDAIYLGVSYGFYVDDEDKAAAAGWPGAPGWQWSPIDASAPGIRQAIQVFNKDQTAAFVTLPVEVQP